MLYKFVLTVSDITLIQDYIDNTYDKKKYLDIKYDNGFVILTKKNLYSKSDKYKPLTLFLTLLWIEKVYYKLKHKKDNVNEQYNEFINCDGNLKMIIINHKLYSKKWHKKLKKVLNYYYDFGIYDDLLNPF